MIFDYISHLTAKWNSFKSHGEEIKWTMKMAIFRRCMSKIPQCIDTKSSESSTTTSSPSFLNLLVKIFCCSSSTMTILCESIYKTINFYRCILLVFGFESTRCKIKFHWFYIKPKKFTYYSGKICHDYCIISKAKSIFTLHSTWSENIIEKINKLSHIKITHQNFNDKIM